MKTALYLLFSLLFLAACNNSTIDKKASKIMPTTSKIANTKLALSVQGMVCKMGCGGSIRKELLATNAVEKVEVDFVEEKESQLITVYYNNSLSSKEKLLKVINEMNDKQFTAQTISESSYISDKK
jgi:copper chaperone CopZ